MPISHRHKCIYIHIPKTAGSSIEEAIFDIDTTGPQKSKSNEDKLFGIISEKARLMYGISYEFKEWQHLPLTELKKIIPDTIWNSYFKFTFVRNPWDRMVSWYFYLKSQIEEAEKFSLANLRHFIISKSLKVIRGKPKIADTFNEWIFDCSIDSAYFSDGRITRNQLDWINDDNGNLQVDFVGRFECIQRDFNYICERLRLSKSLPHVRKSIREPFINYYSDKTKQIVEKRFEKDIEFFKYDFNND